MADYKSIDEVVNSGKKYQIIYADPPWSYKVWSNKGAGRSAESHYHTMDAQSIRNMPVKDIADKNAAPHIKITYTNIMRDMITVISILPGVASNPGANPHTTSGINISNNIVIPSNTTINQENTLRAKFSSFLESVYIGINIADNAPSPSKSRNRFGNLNAAKNISDTRPAPRTRAINMSRIKPKMRLIPVIAPTPKICLPSFIV